MSSRYSLAFLLVAGCLVLSGCTGGKLPSSVSGKVTYQGRPVTSGMVVLVAPDGKTSAPGAVRPDGTYTIQHAPTGTVKVSFDNPPPPHSYAPAGAQNAAARQEAQQAAAEAKFYVPTPLHYKDPEKSGLTLQLKKGKNDNCDLVLR
jgi:hypothetical protein